MNRLFFKRLLNHKVPEIFTATVTRVVGGGRYEVVAVDGTKISASADDGLYSRGDRVRVRGTVVVGLARPLSSVKEYEV